MNKPSVWRPGGHNASGGSSVRRPLRSVTPSVWRSPNHADARTATKPPPKQRKKRYYTVEINEAWCKNCGICSAFCPTGTLEDAGHGEPRIADMDLCNDCELCVVRCPDFAVVVHERSKDNGDADVRVRRDAPDTGQ